MRPDSSLWYFVALQCGLEFRCMAEYFGSNSCMHRKHVWAQVEVMRLFALLGEHAHARNSRIKADRQTSAREGADYEKIKEIKDHWIGFVLQTRPGFNYLVRRIAELKEGPGVFTQNPDNWAAGKLGPVGTHLRSRQPTVLVVTDLERNGVFVWGVHVQSVPLLADGDSLHRSRRLVCLHALVEHGCWRRLPTARSDFGELWRAVGHGCADRVGDSRLVYVR